MRLRIIVKPTGTIDGIVLNRFQIGSVYELGPHLSCVFIANGWAEYVGDDGFAPPLRAPTDRTDVYGIVLVVDDDRDLREFAGTVLKSRGYQVVVAQHGRDAIARLREHCPDVIVLDLHMPVMDAWQFRAEQQGLDDRRLAAIPVVLLSSDEDVARHATTLKAAAFLPKPFDPDALNDVIRTAVRARSFND